ncbi:MAG: chromate efflux transporter [Thiothrix sp.]|nr:MAG: chromate efflux transporter [Thiothrix sp.]
MDAANSSPDTPPPKPSFQSSLKYWLKLGFISFGGPAGQIAMMHTDLVDKKRWISEQRFLHALNYCMLLPGPEATQLAIYINWLLYGAWGGIAAGLLFILPAFILLCLLAALYLTWGDLPLVQGLFYGIKPAVVAIVLFAAWRIGSRSLKNPWLWSIAGLAFGAIFFFNISFPLIVLAAALFGMLGGRLRPDKFQLSQGHTNQQTSKQAAVIDDHSPPPNHARFKQSRLLLIGLLFVATWGVSLGLISKQAVLADMGIFFTKAAFLTIGGAYAVLPYVYQGAVEHFQWLTAGQMIDGLALGETTPGPLIMIVTWIGYIGGVTKELGLNSVLSGLAGATVATFFTFLPSFLFILVGAPVVEATRGQLKFTAPLTAITAAVVGVILNLAVFFAWHVFWPQATATEPFQGEFDLFAVIVAATAFIALWKYKVDTIYVIATSALMGLAYFMWRL